MATSGSASTPAVAAAAADAADAAATTAPASMATATEPSEQQLAETVAAIDKLTTVAAGGPMAEEDAMLESTVALGYTCELGYEMPPVPAAEGIRRCCSFAGCKEREVEGGKPFPSCAKCRGAFYHRCECGVVRCAVLCCAVA